MLVEVDERNLARSSSAQYRQRTSGANSTGADDTDFSRNPSDDAVAPASDDPEPATRLGGNTVGVRGDIPSGSIERGE